VLEKTIVTAILRYLKSLQHCFAWKTHGDAYSVSGIPDIIACIDGRFFAFEVKTPDGKLTKLQEITLQRINDAKGNAFKVTSLQEVKEILERLIS
jgi:Holliday junction resolvase